MKTRCLGLAMLFGALTALTATASLAQQQPAERGRLRSLPERSERWSTEPRGSSCQAWCPQDSSPCDPPNFKVADGRCRGTRP